MNYIDPRFETPQPGGLVIGRAEFAPSTGPARPYVDDHPEMAKITAVTDVLTELSDLRSRLSRADATNNFLAESLKAANEECESYRAYLGATDPRSYGNPTQGSNASASDCLVLPQSAIDKAPPGVADWLKAFGVYSGSPTPSTAAREPEKPADPRSEQLGRALTIANRSPDGYGR